MKLIYCLMFLINIHPKQIDLILCCSFFAIEFSKTAYSLRGVISTVFYNCVFVIVSFVYCY